MSGIKIREDLLDQYVNSTSMLTFRQLEARYNDLTKVVSDTAANNLADYVVENRGVLRPIPDEYLWDESGFKRSSPIANILRPLRLSQIPCPECGQLFLETHYYDNPEGCDGLVCQVMCDNCGWQCPGDGLQDYGEAIAEFKSWLAAFMLMGCPKHYLDIDCSKYFFKNENDCLKKIGKAMVEEEQEKSAEISADVECMMKEIIHHCCSLISAESASRILKEVLFETTGGKEDE